jgi:valyl-tRNA synthetase
LARKPRVQKELIKHLARLKDIQAIDVPRGLRLAASGREAWLDLTEEVMYEHQTNLEVRLAETRAFVTTLEARLSNESYIKKAPENLVEESRKQLETKQKVIDRLEAELEILK